MFHITASKMNFRVSSQSLTFSTKAECCVQGISRYWVSVTRWELRCVLVAFQELEKSWFVPPHSQHHPGWGISDQGLHRSAPSRPGLCSKPTTTAPSANSRWLFHLWRSGASARLYRKWQVLNYRYNLFSVYWQELKPPFAEGAEHTSHFPREL